MLHFVSTPIEPRDIRIFVLTQRIATVEKQGKYHAVRTL